MSIPRRHLTTAVLKDYVDRLVADDAGSTVVPSLEVCIPITVPDAATGDIDVVVPDKIEIVEMVCIKTGGAGAGNTMQLKDGSGNAITDAVACATDDAVTRSATRTDTGSRHIIAAGGTLRLTATRAAGTRNALCLVRGLLRA